MAFTWLEDISQFQKVKNSNISEIVNNITFLETVTAMPADSQHTFPAGEKPFQQQWQIIRASSMGNVKKAIDKIDDYNDITSCSAYCTTVNTSYKTTHYGAHYSDYKATYKSGDLTVNRAHNATYKAYKSYNSSNRSN